MYSTGYQLSILPASFTYKKYNSKTKRSIQYDKLHHVISKKSLKEALKYLSDDPMRKKIFKKSF